MKAIIYLNEKAPALFKNKFLNKLTWSNPLLIFGMYGTLAAILIYFYLTSYEGTTQGAIGLFTLGMFSWTFAEYILHRFLYHKISDASYDKGFQYMFHGVHHSYPNDESKTILPPVPSLIIAGILFGVFYLIMGKYAFAFAPGFVIGYGTYMWIHYAVHKLPTPKKYNFWWKHHNIHHYQQHDRAFGVSSPIWDYVFGTMPEKNRRTVEIEVKRSKKKA